MALPSMISPEVSKAVEFLKKLGDCLSHETSVKQAAVLFVVAQAGNGGMDASSLEKKLGMSPAAISRTIRLLSKVSYDRSEGFGLIDLELDPMDNRRRIVRLNKQGEQAIQKMIAGFTPKK